MHEEFFSCPYCGETVSVLLDLSSESESYIEDCEVCCRPILFNVEALEGELTRFSADRS